MINQEFYNILDQAGHRLGNLAKNSPAYEFELHKLIKFVEEKSLGTNMKTLNVDKLEKSVRDLLKRVKPTTEEFDKNSLLAIYWDSVEVTAELMLQAIKNSSE